MLCHVIFYSNILIVCYPPKHLQSAVSATAATAAFSASDNARKGQLIGQNSVNLVNLPEFNFVSAISYYSM